MIALIIPAGTALAGLTAWLWCPAALRTALAWLRYQAARVFCRPVPADGLPLDQDEARAFIDAVRAWDLPAREPAPAGRKP